MIKYSRKIEQLLEQYGSLSLAIAESGEDIYLDEEANVPKPQSPGPGEDMLLLGSGRGAGTLKDVENAHEPDDL